MEYSATVFNKHNHFKHDYTISVEPEAAVEKGNVILRPVSAMNNAHDETTELCYQVALVEYEHCIKRMERLDNKIYIVLTVCALFSSCFFKYNCFFRENQNNLQTLLAVLL